ncbi:MAG: putative Ig domain-containing protein, partial [Fibrobacteres bacterium]|nr:putative Ig domain-containing protein [Fibrobacterota bacterium]
FDRFDDGSKGKVNYAGWLSDTNGTPAVTGVSGTLQIGTAAFPDRPWYLPGDTAIIRLCDPNLNLNSGAAEQIKVAVSSNQETLDSVVLTEQGIDTSCFYGTVIIQEGASGVSNDGKLHALPGSQLKVRYKDLLNDFGQQIDVDRIGVLVKTYVAQYSTVSGNWTAAGSPYMIDGSITIPVGDTLTLGAGTKLIMRKKMTQYAWENGDTIAVYGHIRANGISTDSVHFDFMSPEKGPDSWFGILARNGGTVNLRYASICNAKTAIDMSVSYGDTTIDTFRLSKSSIKNCKQAVKAFVGRPDRMVFVIDSNDVDMPLPDSMGQYAVHFEYGQGSDGDSVAITGNVFKIHNKVSSNSGGAVIISSRNNGGIGAKTAIIRNNRLSSDSLVNSHNMFVGIQLASSWNIKIDSNEILGFGRGIYMYSDSGIDIRTNRFDGNFVHVSRGGSNYTSWVNYNDFGLFRPGGYSVYYYMESTRDLDARFNYWGSTATGEMTSGGNPKNISAIFDFYDNPVNSKVIYTGWRLSPVGNQPPVFSSSAPLSALQGRQWVYNMVASDPNGDTVVFVPRGLPSGAFITGNELKWRPLIFGTFPVTVGAAAGGDTVEQHFMLNVARDSVKPGNPLTLNVVAISDSAFKLTWNPASLNGTDADSVGIWATSTHYPDSAPYMGGVLYSKMFSRFDTTAIAAHMWPKLGLYFSLFIKDSAGNWSTLGAQAFARTLDLQSPDTVQGLAVVSLGKDSVKLNWVPSSSTDIDSIAICLRQDSLFPSTPSDGRIGSVSAGTGQFKAYGLQEKKVARFALFTRDSSGNWSIPKTASLLIPDATKPTNNLVLTAIPQNETTIQLRWNKAVLTGTDAQWVRILHGATKATSVIDTATHLTSWVPASDSTVLIGGLSAKTGYWFTAFVVDSATNHSDTAGTSTVFATTLDETAPDNVSGFATSYAGLGKISLKWKPSVSTDVESVFVCYRTDAVYPAHRHDGTLLKTYTARDSIDTVGALLEGNTYKLSLFAQDSSGNISALSASAQSTILVKTPATNVASITASAIDTGSIGVKVDYTGNNADSVLIRVDTVKYVKNVVDLSKAVRTAYVKRNVTTDTLKIFTGLTSATLYYVSAYSKNGLFWSDSIADFKGDTAMTKTYIAAAPVFTVSYPDTISIFADTAFTLNTGAADANGDVVTFALITQPSGMTISAATGIISWNPTASDVGVYNVNVRASDGKLYDTLAFNLKVNISNRSPVFVTTADSMPSMIPEKVLWTKSVRYYDPDSAKGDRVKIFIDSKPTGMTFDTATGLISWTPTPAQTQNGPHLVSMRAIDTKGLEDTLRFNITVEDINEQPEFNPFTAKDTAYQELLFQRIYGAVDPDLGDLLKYSLLSAPTGMMIDSTDGTLRFTPVEGQSGTFVVKAMVTDRGGLSDTLVLTLAMINRNDPPAITTSLTDEIIQEKLSKTWSLSASDPDAGDNVKWIKLSGPAGMKLDSVSGKLTWLPGNSDVGIYPVSVSVMDIAGLSDTAKFNLTVLNVNDAPVLSVKEGPLVKYGSVKIKFHADDIDRLNKVDSVLVVRAVLKTTAGGTPVYERVQHMRETDSLFEFYPVKDGAYTVELSATDDSLKASSVNKSFEVGTAGQSTVVSTFGADYWHMISLPTDAVELPSVLTDTSRRAFVWSPTKEVYLDPAEGFTEIKRGASFWLYSSDVVSVTAPRLLTDSSYSKACTLRVDTGWNMIASPYAYAVALPNADLRYWSNSMNDYVKATVMEPWKGYFFYSFTAEPIVLSGKPFNPDSSELSKVTKVAKLNKESGEWLINVKALSGGKVDMMNSFGVLLGADEKDNNMNMAQPPRSPNGGPLVAFQSGYAKTLLDRSVVAPYEGTRKWLMYIEPAAGTREVELNFSGLSSLPEGFYAYIDQSGACYKMAGDSTVLISAKSGVYVSVIVSDDPDYLAKRIVNFNLAQNVPNPFNPVTTINYAIPAAYRADGKPIDGGVDVSLSVYDLRGRLVKKIASGVHKFNGKYSVTWNGKDTYGKVLSSGIYVYRLEAGNWRAVKRMVMTK